MTRRTRSRALLATGLSLLLGSAALADLGFAKETATREAAVTQGGPFWVEGDSGPTPGRPDSFADLAEKLSAAVVFIEIERPTPQFGPHELPFPFPAPDEGQRPQGRPQRRPRSVPAASGSGFVISPDGYILTNDHVIEEATKITVQLVDGAELVAQVVGRDAKTDVALIKVSSPDRKSVV